MLEKLPRLTTLAYHPRFSVAWDDEKLFYYQHKDRPPGLSFLGMARLVPEYLGIWGWFWLRNLPRIPRLAPFFWKKMVGGFCLPKRAP